MYNLATATVWILLADLGTVRLTVCLSSSERIEGIAACFATSSAELEEVWACSSAQPSVGLGRGWWGVLLTPLLGSTWEESQSLGKPVEAACGWRGEC